MSRGYASNWRIALLALAVLGCFGGLGVRLVFLHVIDRGQLMRFVNKARREIIVENARRGDILDTHGNILATSRPLIVLGVDPQMTRPEDAAKWPELARLAGLTPDQVRAAMARKDPDPAAAADEAGGADDSQPRLVRWVKLSDHVEESVFDQIRKLGIRGVYGTRAYRRVYPQNSLAAQVIGYLNQEGAPVSGMERYMDFYLRGENGWCETEKDGLRRELAQFRTRDVPPADGYDVVLSIDGVVQHIIEDEARAIAEKFHPEKISIIVSDPRTGFILGMANYPTFDLNNYSQAPLASQRNVSVADMYEPGSVFKIVAVSGALNEGLVTPQTRFDCTLRTVDYQGRTLKLPRDDYTYDHPLTVAEIISRSSNKGAAQLGMLLGAQRLYDYARSYGFGEKSGFPVGGEITGDLAPPARWDSLTITRLPMGQAVGVTPLQMHYAMAAIAAGGVLMRPQIIRQVRDATGEVVYNFGPQARRRVISARTAEIMEQILIGVTRQGGTAADTGSIPGFQVAGKTGTSQKVVNGHYSHSEYVSSFVGFFPASRPRVVISVIVDNAHMPHGGTAFGTDVAAPSFRHIGEQLIPYLDIKPVLAPASDFAVLEGGRW